MYDANDFQVRDNDYQRQIAWANETGWQFNPPMTRKGIRVVVAQALIALATRLITPIEQPHTA
jgi:hypothetical protein